MRNGFGLNTNLFETNLLNLGVVVRFVVTVGRENLQIILDQRRQIIVSTLEERSRKESALIDQLDEANAAVAEATIRAEEILIQADKTIQKDNSTAKEQLKNRLTRFQSRRKQTVILERQKQIKIISQDVADKALTLATGRLAADLDPTNNNGLSLQKKLNILHLEDTFRKLRLYVIFSLNLSII
jgi:F-type H+-transporting ATPase subunit b